MQFYSDNPNRDIDLARKLKSVLLVAFPGVHVIGYARSTQPKGLGNENLEKFIATGTGVQGDLTPDEMDSVKQAVKKIAQRTIGQELVSRHPVVPRRLAATG